MPSLADPIGRYQTGVVATKGPPGPNDHVATYPMTAGSIIGYHNGVIMAHPAVSGFTHPAFHTR